MPNDADQQVSLGKQSLMNVPASEVCDFSTKCTQLLDKAKSHSQLQVIKLY